MEKALFITLEGIEGAGKSTQMAAAQNFLRAHGRKVICTREPGGTAVGEALRSLLIGGYSTGIHKDTELLLMFAARAEHLKQVIEPALEQGCWVICDRFTDASYAYQGGGRGIAMERIKVLEDWVQGPLQPNLTLLFDLPVEQGLGRTKRRDSVDRFEMETEIFFERVRKTYLRMARQLPHRYRVIDASRDKDAVKADIQAILRELLGL